MSETLKIRKRSNSGGSRKKGFRPKSMFGSQEEGATFVKKAVKDLISFGMPVQLSLIIRRLKIDQPELGLDGFEPGAIKQAVYKIVRAHRIPLEQGRK